MPQITVDIDMKDIDTDDLIEELSSRLNNDRNRKQIIEDKNLVKSIRDFLSYASVFTSMPEVRTIEDKMKVEHLAEVWNKYTSWQLQQMLPA